MAAAITAYDTETESIEDKSYGELELGHWLWDFETGDYYGSADEYHSCTDEELGLNRTDNTFLFPIKESMLYEVETYLETLSN